MLNWQTILSAVTSSILVDFFKHFFFKSKAIENLSDSEILMLKKYPNHMDNLDLEKIFSKLNIKPIERHEIHHIMQYPSPIKTMVRYSKFKGIYLEFSDNTFNFTKKYDKQTYRKINKIIFKILYYILAFIAVILIFNLLFDNLYQLHLDLKHTFISSITLLFFAIESAVKSISIEIAEEMVNQRQIEQETSLWQRLA